MKDRDHNEAMAEMFQADPRFAADYLRQAFADGEPGDVRLGLLQMVGVLSVHPVSESHDADVPPISVALRFRVQG